MQESNTQDFPRLIDNSETAAMVGLMFDRLHRAVDHSFEFGKLRYEEGDERLEDWGSGALYGMCALYMLESTEGAADSDDIAFTWKAVSEMVTEIVNDPEGINGALRRLCSEAFEAEELDHA